MLLILNLPLIGIWVRLLKVPYSYLFPFIFLFCLIGAYTVGNNILDVYIMILFGILGYLMKKYEYEPAPLVLAFVLGPMLENALRQSLSMAAGSPLIFLTRPIAVTLIGAGDIAVCGSNVRDSATANGTVAVGICCSGIFGPHRSRPRKPGCAVATPPATPSPRWRVPLHTSSPQPGGKPGLC